MEAKLNQLIDYRIGKNGLQPHVTVIASLTRTITHYAWDLMGGSQLQSSRVVVGSQQFQKFRGRNFEPCGLA